MLTYKMNMEVNLDQETEQEICDMTSIYLRKKSAQA